MWTLLALAYALITSIHIPIIKKVSNQIDSFTFVFVANLFIIPLMVGGLYFLGGIPHVEHAFYLPMLIASILDTIAFVLAVTAFAHSELSLVVPLAAFVPVFATIFNFFLTGEAPSLIKSLGILLVVIGTYVLHLESCQKNVFAPFKKLVSMPGARLFLLANLLWGFVPIFQKLAIFATTPPSPPFVAAVGTILMSLYVLPVLLMRKSEVLRPGRRFFWILLFAGVLVTCQQFALQTAYSLQNVGYVLAIGKLSSLLVVMWGFMFFGEKFTAYRLIGTMIMILGAVLLL